jgi:hypothetical protein
MMIMDLRQIELEHKVIRARKHYPVGTPSTLVQRVRIMSIPFVFRFTDELLYESIAAYTVGTRHKSYFALWKRHC